MISYDQFCERAREFGLFGLLPDYFDLIDDEGIYPTSELAEIVGMHRDSIARLCSQGKIRSEGISHYKIKGIEAKRYFFTKIQKRFPKDAKKILGIT